MKRVLLIDDRRAILEGIRCEIQNRIDEDIVIDLAQSYYDAIYFLETYTYEIITLDLNMPQIPDQKYGKYFEEIPGTTLNGWLFLKYCVFNKESSIAYKTKTTKIIVFSGYLDELRKHINSNPDKYKEEEWLRVEKYTKGNGDYTYLVNRIEQVLKN